MRTESYIKERIKQMEKVDSFDTKKEIKELPKILQDDEELLYLTSGILDGNTWLIAATSERVIFLDKGMIYGLKQLETPLDKINSISQSTGLIFGEISIWDGASKAVIKQCVKATVKPFVECVNNAIKQMKEKNRTVVNNVINAATNEEDISVKLEKLAKLKEQGILTEEEFIQGKAKLLGI